MNQSRTKDLVLGVLSIWPLAYYGIVVQMIIPILVRIEGFDNFLGVHYFVYYLSLFLCIGLFFYYFIRVFFFSQYLGERKKWWILAMLLAGPFAWPVFWHLYIWKRTK